MPYIEGETLRDKLNREIQLGIEEAVRITTAVADALDHAHRHGIVHRDIKPENILLQEGLPLVADFGIALALSAGFRRDGVGSPWHEENLDRLGEICPGGEGLPINGSGRQWSSSGSGRMIFWHSSRVVVRSGDELHPFQSRYVHQRQPRSPCLTKSYRSSTSWPDDPAIGSC